MRSDLVAEGICGKLGKKRSRLTADKCHLKNRTREKNISFSVKKNLVGNILIFASFVSVADPMRNVSWMLFPGGTELGTQVKTGSRAGRTNSQ